MGVLERRHCTSLSASHEKAFAPALERLHGYMHLRQPWRGDMATSLSASHEKATNSRQPWRGYTHLRQPSRGYTATCIRASLGEATRLHAFAPASERLHDYRFFRQPWRLQTRR